MVITPTPSLFFKFVSFVAGLGKLVVSQLTLPILLHSQPAVTPPNHCKSSTNPSSGKLFETRVLFLLSISVQLSYPYSETHNPNIFFGGTSGRPTNSI